MEVEKIEKSVFTLTNEEEAILRKTVIAAGIGFAFNLALLAITRYTEK